MSQPAKYRKKPVVIEAVLLEANDLSIASISGWLLAHGCRTFKVHGDKRPFGIALPTLEGTMIASPGDYIIKGTEGEFYPCKPAPFAATFEPA